MLREHARFVQRRNRDPLGAEIPLPLGHLDALVRLHVRSKGDSERAGSSSHPLQVSLEHIQVQQKSRCGEILYAHVVSGRRVGDAAPERPAAS